MKNNIIVFLALSLMISGCSVSYKSTKREAMKEQLVNSRFYCYLGGSFGMDTELKLEDSMFIFRNGPEHSYGKWDVSSDGKYLHIRSAFNRVSNDIRYIEVNYKFKIRNAHTLILNEYNWIYKRAENIPRE